MLARARPFTERGHGRPPREVTSHRSQSSKSLIESQAVEDRPAGICGDCFTRTRFAVAVATTNRAEPGTVVTAQGCEWEPDKNRLATHEFQVDALVGDRERFLFEWVIGVHLAKLAVCHPFDLDQTPSAGRHPTNRSGTGGENAITYSFEHCFDGKDRAGWHDGIANLKPVGRATEPFCTPSPGPVQKIGDVDFKRLHDPTL